MYTYDVYYVITKYIMSERTSTQFITTIPGEVLALEDETRLAEAIAAVGKLATPRAITSVRHLMPSTQEVTDEEGRWHLLEQGVAALISERPDLIAKNISRKLSSGLDRVGVRTVGQVLSLSSEQTLLVPHLSAQAVESRRMLPRFMAALRRESGGVIPPWLTQPEPGDIAGVCRELSDVPSLALAEDNYYDRSLATQFTSVAEIAELSLDEIVSRVNSDYGGGELYALELNQRATNFASEFQAAKLS